MAECVTIMLQEKGKGATWIFEDSYYKHQHFKKFEYGREDLERILKQATAWAEGFIKKFGNYQKQKLPWL